MGIIYESGISYAAAAVLLTRTSSSTAIVSGRGTPSLAATISHMSSMSATMLGAGSVSGTASVAADAVPVSAAGLGTVLGAASRTGGSSTLHASPVGFSVLAATSAHQWHQSHISAHVQLPPHAYPVLRQCRTYIVDVELTHVHLHLFHARSADAGASCS